MNEFELISRLTRSLPTNPSVVVGPGDDCAVLDAGLPDRLAAVQDRRGRRGHPLHARDSAREDRT